MLARRVPMLSEGSSSGRLRGTCLPPGLGRKPRGLSLCHWRLCQLNATWQSGRFAASPLFPTTCFRSFSTPPLRHRILFAHRDPIGNVGLSARRALGWLVRSQFVCKLLCKALTPPVAQQPGTPLDSSRSAVLDDGWKGLRILVAVPAGWYDLTPGRRSGRSDRQPQTRSAADSLSGKNSSC